MEGAEGFEKAAVVGEAAVGAGVQDAASGGDFLTAVLHAQVSDIIVDAFHGVFFKDPGKVLPAGEGVFGQERCGQARICVVVPDVFYRSGNQGAGTAGRWHLCMPVFYKLVDKKLELYKLAGENNLLAVPPDVGNLDHPFQKAPQIPGRYGMGVEYDNILLPLGIAKTRLADGHVPDTGTDLDHKPVGDCVCHRISAGMVELRWEENHLPGVQGVEISQKGVLYITAGYEKNNLMVGVGMDYRLLIFLVCEPGYRHLAFLQIDPGHFLGEQRIGEVVNFLDNHKRPPFSKSISGNITFCKFSVTKK